MEIIARPWEPQDLLDDLQMYIDEEPDNYLNGRRTAMCMARDYLKELFARELGCDWCDYFERDRQFLIGEGNGMYKELIYQFCPMCGRKLKEGAEHEG